MLKSCLSGTQALDLLVSKSSARRFLENEETEHDAIKAC